MMSILAKRGRNSRGYAPVKFLKECGYSLPSFFVQSRWWGTSGPREGHLVIGCHSCRVVGGRGVRWTEGRMMMGDKDRLIGSNCSGDFTPDVSCTRDGRVRLDIAQRRCLMRSYRLRFQPDPSLKYAFSHPPKPHRCSHPTLTALNISRISTEASLTTDTLRLSCSAPIRPTPSSVTTRNMSMHAKSAIHQYHWMLFRGPEVLQVLETPWTGRGGNCYARRYDFSLLLLVRRD